MVLVAGGLGWVMFAILTGETVLNRYYRQYTAYLSRMLRLLFLDGSGERIVAGQAAVGIGLTAAGIALHIDYWYLGLPLVIVLPAVNLTLKRRAHNKRLEDQTDGLIVALANGLKTVPSPAAALASVTPILPLPMRLEIDRLLKEMRVGSTLEQGLLNMSSRVQSRELDTALSAVLVGLQVGGNLPVVLENTAATIREMARLQGVVRTKTSEARAQLWVLAVFPFAICGAFKMLDPEFFVPLQNNLMGTLITSVAVTLWLAALFSARKILQVDI
jgi:tight adherence protein B